MLIHTERIFADHYQFYIHDSQYDHINDPNLDWEIDQGYENNYRASEKGIYVGTVAHLNDHRVRIFINEIPKKDKYERVFEHSINIASGKIQIDSPSSIGMDPTIIEIAPGVYTIFVCGNSIGKDLFSYGDTYDEDMDDEDFLKLELFEYYDIFLKR